MKFKIIDEVLNSVTTGDLCDIHGRVSSVRRHGKVLFMDLVDHSGKVQVVLEKPKHPEQFDTLSRLRPGSYISVNGTLGSNRDGDPEVNANCLIIRAQSSLNISPTPWEMDGTDPKHGHQVFGFPGIYVSNPQRSAVLAIKTNFVNALHNYFQDNRFQLVEPPMLTSQVLYTNDNAISANVHGEDVFLSQCATFELEPLAMQFGKVYTISPAFRNEMGGSKRHLAEYTHAKAEVMLADIDDLMFLAGDSLYHALKKTVEISQRELSTLGKEIDFEGLHPNNVVFVTYDEALKISQRKGSTTEYGSGLTRRDEMALTDHVDGKYVWMKFPPFASEGFPYRRSTENPDLSMTCDLIAPHGAGEMVGVAEKTTSAEELVENLIAKGKKDAIASHWQYIMLRRFGLPDHGGIGAAPERIIYGLLGLNHIRLTKPWPRYPDRKINMSYPQGLPTFDDPELERLVQKYDLKEK